MAKTNAGDDARYNKHPLADGNGWVKEQKFVLESIKEIKEDISDVSDRVTDIRIELGRMSTRIQLICVIASILMSGSVTLLIKVFVK